MASIVITLREIKKHHWALIAPKGHKIGNTFRGDKFEALKWAEIWISGFHSWTIKQEVKDD